MKKQFKTIGKTLLAFFTIACLVAAWAPVQAVTLYDDGDTKIDLYSRLYLLYEKTDAGRITGNDSRIGLRTSSRVNDDLSVFARAEFRYDASQRERNQVFNDRRNTYVGLKSSIGQLTVGNFDSIYYQSVSHVMDIFENEGFIALGQGGTAGRANSVAYSSPELHGLKLHVQARHYPEGDTVSGDEEFIFQAGATFKIQDLSLGVSAIIDNEDAGRDETLIGFSAQYKVIDALSVRLLVENQKDVGEQDYHAALGLIFNYGMGDLYASVGQDPDEETYFSLGANYKFSKPMRVFAEYCNGETIDPDDVITVGFRYDF